MPAKNHMDRMQRVSREFMELRYCLLAYINACVGHYQNAEDIFQEVWLSVLKATNEGKEIHDLRAWCLKVARNRVMRHRRSLLVSRREQAVTEEVLTLLGGAIVEDPGEDTPWEERVSVLNECMKRLRPRAREIMRLRYFDSLSIEDMAGKLKKPAQGVYLALSRTRRWLRECVEKTLRRQEHPV
jgi:RNA polymerase sigma-70 factor (ECF subfamily)